MSTIEGQSAADAGDMGLLASFASNPKEARREEIYLAVVSLYRVQGNALAARERGLMNDILRRIEGDVRPAVRISLAERLADDVLAPTDVILLLATDIIEVAAPVIARSPLLTSERLQRLIENSDKAHQVAIASRPEIGEAVTERIAESNEQSVLIALVQNHSARLSAKTFDTVLAKSVRNEDLREALASRPDLPPAIRGQLSAAEKRDATAHPAIVIGPDGIDRLVAKLASSGQLRAGFLLRVLQQGQVDLFDAGLARLLDIPIAQSRERFYGGGPTAVALACRAVGIDRCVFSTVYSLSRQSRGMAAALSASDRTRVEEVFTFHSKPTALAVLRAA